jgi:hypothetical protein
MPCLETRGPAVCGREAKRFCHSAEGNVSLRRPVLEFHRPMDPYTRVLYRPANSAKDLFFGQSLPWSLLNRQGPDSGTLK